ncbi:MAG: 4Fe-4S dicluster domain-containing protein [Oscillospiraceae bacterium]|nr:4Fe-4S dicluster domain-containing protein [Oscillospiraceae bacterium]
MPEESRGSAAGQEFSCGDHIVQYSPEYSFCTGCVSCTIVCGLSHEGVTGRSNSRIQVDLDARSMVHTVLACQQCADRPCYEACPKKDSAMCVDPETGVVYVDEENCIGCGKCMRACRFTPSRISMKRDRDRKKWKAVKCDLCRGNPDGPQCIRWCPVQCLGLSSGSVLLPDGVRPEGR